MILKYSLYSSPLQPAYGLQLPGTFSGRGISNEGVETYLDSPGRIGKIPKSNSQIGPLDPPLKDQSK